MDVLPAVRFVRWAVLGSVLVAILVSVVLAGRSPSSPQSLSAVFGGGTDTTRWGPLTAADRDMLIKVRQADLWEGPASEQAAQRASRPVVREVGRKLAIEHAQLDADLRVVADKLGMPLPSQPSDAQQVWMSEIAAAPPGVVDARYVNLVRSAHGEVMPLVEGVRSGTQNQLVRAFAIEAGEFIGRHMGYLESTGEVDYALFPPSTAPAARLAALGGYDIPVTLLLFVVAVLVAAAMLRGLSRPRPGLAVPDGGGWGRWLAATATGIVGRRPTRRPPGRRAERPRPRRIGATTAAGEPARVTTAELIAMLDQASGEFPAIPGQRPAPGRPVPRGPGSAQRPAPRRSADQQPAPAVGRERTGWTERATSGTSRATTPRRPPVKLGRCTDRHPW